MDDLLWLRMQYPQWEFGTTWTTTASGPDRRRLWARCGDVLLTAWDAAGLRRKIEAAGD